MLDKRFAGVQIVIAVNCIPNFYNGQAIVAKAMFNQNPYAHLVPFYNIAGGVIKNIKPFEVITITDDLVGLIFNY